jgi:RNA polymerase sigma-70 factor, ECF subfamily
VYWETTAIEGCMSDENQFEAFMRDYQGMVFTTASRLLGNDAEAEDVCQEVFLRAFQRFEALQESGTAGGWLKTVTRNLCLNYLSRYRSRWRFFSEFFSRDETEETPDWPGPDGWITAGEGVDERELLERALQALPRAQRVPLVLYHFEELSYEEIASMLGVSLGKVKTDIFRGRKALKQMIEPMLGAGGVERERRPHDSGDGNEGPNRSVMALWRNAFTEIPGNL